MRIGIVADVHCRHEALREAAGELVARGVDEILLAGDAHLQYRFSTETVEVIRAFGIRCVAGNTRRCCWARPGDGRWTRPTCAPPIWPSCGRSPTG